MRANNAIRRFALAANRFFQAFVSVITQFARSSRPTVAVIPQLLCNNLPAQTEARASGVLENSHHGGNF
jgi:hypothetical protein